MTTTDSKPTIHRTTAPYAELAAGLRGELITPGDPGYDEARAVYNAMIDKRPGGDRPGSGRRRRRRLRAVRRETTASRSPFAAAATTPAGSASGTTPWSSTCPRLRSTTVDPTATPSGSTAAARGATSTTPPSRSGWPRRPASSPRPASAGLTLGGGIGYLTRRFGLTVDNLLVGRRRARRRHASSPRATARNTDLFWALRGRRRQLRRRHVVHLPLPRHRRARERSSAARCSTTSPTPPTSCAGIGSCCRRCPRNSAAGSG